MFVLYFNRKVSLQTHYTTNDPDNYKSKTIDGTYEGFVPIAADLGVSVGIIKEPFILCCKVSHPLFTGGGGTDLRDTNPKKIKDGTDIFPSDFTAYVNRTGSYGIRSNIDGWKVLFTGEFAIKLSKDLRRRR